MCSEIKERRQDIAAFINTILTDLRNKDAFYHPLGEDIIKWFEVTWSVIYSVLSDPKDRQLWNETTPAKGRNKQVIRFLKSECWQLTKGTISRATSYFEIATRFQTRYPDSTDKVKLIHYTQILEGIVQNLAKHCLTTKEKSVRKIGLKPVIMSKKHVYPIAPNTQIIIDFATQSLNDYLHGRIDYLPVYEEIGGIVSPPVCRARVQQILPKYLPPEAIKFWMLNRCGSWRKIARLLNYASQQADRHFRDNSYHVYSIGRMSRQFDLDNSTVARAIQEHLSKEQATLWGVESESKPISMKVHYRIRYLTKVARKHQNNPSWHLPFQEEIGRKLGISQTTVSRITRQWLPKDLAALWAVRKNHPRG